MSLSDGFVSKAYAATDYGYISRDGKDWVSLNRSRQVDSEEMKTFNDSLYYEQGVVTTNNTSGYKATTFGDNSNAAYVFNAGIPATSIGSSSVWYVRLPINISDNYNQIMTIVNPAHLFITADGVPSFPASCSVYFQRSQTSALVAAGARQEGGFKIPKAQLRYVVIKYVFEQSEFVGIDTRVLMPYPIFSYNDIDTVHSDLEEISNQLQQIYNAQGSGYFPAALEDQTDSINGTISSESSAIQQTINDGVATMMDTSKAPHFEYQIGEDIEDMTPRGFTTIFDFLKKFFDMFNNTYDSPQFVFPKVGFGDYVLIHEKTFDFAEFEGSFEEYSTLLNLIRPFITAIVCFAALISIYNMIRSALTGEEQ